MRKRRFPFFREMNCGNAFLLRLYEKFMDTRPISVRDHVDNFEELSILCERSFSTVLKVKRKTDNAIYAMKKISVDGISHEDIQKAFNEMRFLASSHHENIVRLHESFLTRNHICVVLEFCSHGDLAQEIESQQRMHTFFDEQTIWNYFIQILEALHYLHKNSIVHRDVKPANCFLGQGKMIKLGDMNISKRINDSILLTTLTGTPFYMSPEIWHNLPYDQSSDMWSLGVVLYELCTLHKPFKAGNYRELQRKILHGLYPPIPSEMPEELTSIVTVLLSNESLERPSAAQLLISHSIKQRRQSYFESSLKLLDTPRIPVDFNALNLSRELISPDYAEKCKGSSNKVSGEELFAKSSLVSETKLRPLRNLKFLSASFPKLEKLSFMNLAKLVHLNPKTPGQARDFDCVSTKSSKNLPIVSSSDEMEEIITKKIPTTAGKSKFYSAGKVICD